MQKNQGGYRFSTLEHLTRWLATTKWGKEVLRDVLHTGQFTDLARELVEREFPDSKPHPTYVLVKAFGDGWIEVYGERHVRARVIELPGGTNAEQERLLDEWVSLNLRLPYQEIDYPSNIRAQHRIPSVGFGEYVRRLQQRDRDLELLNSLVRASKILQPRSYASP